ncbi:SDR family NAD(P)-dependent oxidoreductase [Dactylosporangium sp. CS-047395]|uniref:SDR family NAD(P)-dependent oxidoreductase n=1 Tax=Dactylosporangium sp. CS-047395 TaxID=3239936 RepID=UPI003D8B93C4
MSEVLLTGATSGLGRWLAPRLGQAGLTVLVHGRDKSKVERGVAEVEQAGGRAEGFVADLARLGDVDRLAGEVEGRPLTHLVNNAGVGFGERNGTREESKTAMNCAGPSTCSRPCGSPGRCCPR